MLAPTGRRTGLHSSGDPCGLRPEAAVAGYWPA